MALEASEVAVRVRLLGGSAFEADAAKVAAATSRIGVAGAKASASSAATAAALSSTGNKMQSVGNKMMGFGRTLMTVGVPLAAAGYYAAKVNATFNQQMTLLATQAGENIKNLGWMSTQVFAIGKHFGQMPIDLAKGLYNFESVGIHGQKALNDIKAAAMGAAVGLDSMANTSDSLSTVMKSGIGGVGGPMDAMSKMDKAIGLGKMHLQDLTESFRSGIIPLAQQFHLDFPSVLANVAALSGIGTPPSQVAARMRLMLTSMEALNPAGAKALHKVGMGPYDLAKDLAGPGHLITALTDLQTHLSTLPFYQQNAVLAAVFGRSRGMGQIAGSLSQLSTITSDYMAIQRANPSLLETHYQQTSKTSAFKYQQLRSQLDAQLVKLGEVVNQRLLPVLIRLMGPFTSILDGFTRLPRPLQNFLLALMALTIIGGPFFLFAGALVKGAGMFIEGISTLMGMEGFGALSAGIAMTAGEFIALAAPLAAAVVVFELFAAKHGPFADARHAISHAGYKAGEGIVGFLHHNFGILNGAYRANQVKDYLNSSAFKHASPLVQSDIRALMNLKAGAAHSPILGGIESDLAKAGVNPQKIPGLDEAIKRAVIEGMRQAQVNVLLPNGQVLAKTVNDQNRRDQNRR